MKNDDYKDDYEVNIWFRLFGISPKEVAALREEVAFAKDLEVGKYFKNPKVSVVSIQLKKGQRYEELCNFLTKHKIKESSYDFYVSLVTSRDNEGVSVPKHVLDLYRKIGGALGFSFVCG